MTGIRTSGPSPSALTPSTGHSGPPVSAKEPQASVALRRDMYNRKLGIIRALAACLGAGMTLFAAVKFADAASQRMPQLIMSALLLTMVMFTAFLLWWSHGKIQWQLDLLHRHLGKAEDGIVDDKASHPPLTLAMTMSEARQALLDDANPAVRTAGQDLTATWPQGEREARSLAMILELLIFGVLLVYVWLPIFVRAPAPKAPPPVVGILVAVHFEKNQSTIGPEYERQIREATRRVKTTDGSCVRLEGHADLDGGSEYNLALSQLRNDAVIAVAESEGLPRARISTVSYGKTHPQASGGTESAKAQNRRVDLLAESCKPAASSR
jgi:outer membrane protein OmpA-like peptidoglycan-associated protein